ncbi:hypothetical protein COLSTE_02113 [Collinsella stercoris DSM 13279]|uniref:Uncharacterized protein n=1 Tax=Collinsella stercoris DSM 13279 TaxID=445975 RepID=B6GDD5_9ACTN|nr:hypothetical protein COLSTE_02113 [Collinsella stercoris DSM 13279]
MLGGAAGACRRRPFACGGSDFHGLGSSAPLCGWRINAGWV